MSESDGEEECQPASVEAEAEWVGSPCALTGGRCGCITAGGGECAGEKKTALLCALDDLCWVSQRAS